MSRKKADKVFSIVSPGIKQKPTETPHPILHGYVIARHGKGALSVARDLIKGLPTSAFASATSAEMAAKAINAKNKSA